MLGFQICGEKDQANTKRSPDCDNHSESQKSVLVRPRMPLSSYLYHAYLYKSLYILLVHRHNVQYIPWKNSDICCSPSPTSHPLVRFDNLY